MGNTWFVVLEIANELKEVIGRGLFEGNGQSEFPLRIFRQFRAPFAVGYIPKEMASIVVTINVQDRLSVLQLDGL